MTRRYETPLRDERAAQTRDRIVTAASELVHEFPSWDWKGLTFRAVAERAGLGERTVYRHFPTLAVLQDAVVQRLDDEAGLSYDGLTLDGVPSAAAKIFRGRASFAAAASASEPAQPPQTTAMLARRDALSQAVADAASGWSSSQQRTAAAVVDLLWSLGAYERLVRSWGLSEDDANAGLRWAIDLVVAAVEDGRPPGGMLAG